MGLFGASGTLSSVFGGGNNGDILGIPGLNDLNLVDGNMDVINGGLLNTIVPIPGWDTISNVTEDVLGGVGNILGLNPTNTNDATGGTVPTGTIPPGMVCKAADCYSQCRANDVAKTAACRQIQKEYLALMKTVGCKGAKCSMPAMAKTCKKPARACKKAVKYTKCC